MCKRELDLGRASMATYICLEKHSCIRIDRVLVLCNVIAVCSVVFVASCDASCDNCNQKTRRRRRQARSGMDDHPMNTSHVSTSRP